MSSWYAEMKGLNSVLRKLQQLENINTSEILDMVKDETQKMVKQGIASNGFQKSSNYVTVTKEGGGKSTNIKVGLQGESGSFDNWKEAYYHHYGYNLVAWGNKTNKRITVHVGYFDNVRSMTINQVKPILVRRAQERIRNIIR